jgi:glycine/D-amino acid oxidase-like deaminating enzyme
MKFFGELPQQVVVDNSARRRVVVIGAGLVGLSCALWLQRAGHQVTVVDRQPPSSNTSYTHAASYGNACTMAFGACLPLAMPGIWAKAPGMLIDRRGPLAIYWTNLLRLTPWLLAFLKSSKKSEADRVVSTLGKLLRLAEAGHAPLIEESGAGGLVRRAGCLYLYRTAQQFAQARRDMDLREREGVRMEALDVQAISQAEPNLARLYHKAIRFVDAYHLDTPDRYALALAEAIRARGGRFVQGDARTLASADDEVSAILDGEVIRADRVVVACGAWSKPLAASIGDRILLDTERGYHVLFPESGRLLNEPCCYPEYGFYMTPLSEGLRAAGIVELGGLDAPPRRVRADTIANVARSLVPALGKAERTWLGFRPSMPDSLPVIGPSPCDSRFLYAFGHGHIGLTLAGVTGRIVADLTSGLEPPVDIAPLRADRFRSLTNLLPA